MSILTYEDIINDCIVLDLETTGTNTSTDKIIEIGMFEVVNGKNRQEYSQLVNPQETISTFITQLTGITNADLEEQPTIGQLLADIYDFTDGRPVIGHNIKTFDIPLLNNTYQRHGLQPFTPSALIDTLELSKQKIFNTTSYSLQNVMHILGINRTEKHRALNDAYDTYECYEKLSHIHHIFASEADNQYALQLKKTKTRNYFQTRNESEPLNEKPTGYNTHLQGTHGQDIIGEENAQAALKPYEGRKYFYITLKRDLIPEGRNAGEPTITVWLEKTCLGYLTPTYTSKHYHQIPPEGCTAIAHTSISKKSDKIEVRVELPDKEQPSTEYITALAAVNPAAAEKLAKK